MKELSIEDKAKRYDEAIKIAEKYHNGTLKDVMETIFPELKESEDERIRKEIVAYLQYHLAKYCRKSIPKINEWIAWLEKQGEQKHDGKVGDLITNGVLVGRIDEIHELGYHVYFGDYYADVSDIENWHKWTIKDAKRGDVLVHNDCTFIFMGIKDGIAQAIEENMLEVIPFGEPDKDNYYYPATKEQRDSLFKKIKEAGYKWDAEKLELKKVEQNPAWSDEDEYMHIRCIGILAKCYMGELPTKVEEELNWLKSLKERVWPQNSNVTDEELVQAKKDAYNDALDKLEYHSGEPTFDDGWSAAILYLKKRNAQPKQEWSEED